MPTKSVRNKDKTPRKAENIPSTDLKHIVCDAAFALFMDHGYNDTTMRMIFMETGYGAGSTYNAFTGKEDILSTIILSSYSQLLKTVDELIKNCTNKLTALTFPMSVTVYSASTNRKYANLVMNSNRIWNIQISLCTMMIDWGLTLLNDLGIIQDREKMKSNFLHNFAIMGRYVQQYCEEGPQNCIEGIHDCIRTFCWLSNIDCSEVNPAVEETLKLLEEDSKWGLFEVKGRKYFRENGYPED